MHSGSKFWETIVKLWKFQEKRLRIVTPLVRKRVGGGEIAELSTSEDKSLASFLLQLWKKSRRIRGGRLQCRDCRKTVYETFCVADCARDTGNPSFPASAVQNRAPTQSSQLPSRPKPTLGRWWPLPTVTRDWAANLEIVGRQHRFVGSSSRHVVFAKLEPLKFPSHGIHLQLKSHVDTALGSTKYDLGQHSQF